MPFSLHTLGARLSALHAATFAGFGLYMAFFPVWLQSKAMSATTIGIVLAIPIVIRILTAAPLLSLVDRGLSQRRLLIACYAAQVVGFPTLFLIENEVLIAAVIALLAVAQSPVGPTSDLLAVGAVRDGLVRHYGRVRVWGSIGFLSASIVTGYLVDAVGPDLIVWSLILLAFLGSAAVLVLPSGVAAAPREAPRLQPAQAVRLPGVLWLAVAAAALTQSSHATLYAFGSIHWRETGFSDTAIGFLWAIGVVVEIAVFSWLGRSVGRGSATLGLIAVGAAAAALRFAVMALDPGLAGTAVLQALHGLSFGATHLGAMGALSALAPATARGQAQGMAGSVTAFGLALGTVASGPLYRALGALAFAAMVPLCVIAFLLTLQAARILKARPVGEAGAGARPHRAGEGG